MRARRIIWIIAVMAFASSCGCERPRSIEEGRIRPLAYSDGDTLELDPFPPNLSHWISFFGQRFSDFRNGNFKASGVVLHLDSLPQASSRSSTASSYERMVFNQDSSYFISIFGDRNGDIDQQVLLVRADPPDPGRVIMFNGSGVTVETADWLGRDVFVLSRTTVDEKKGIWSPEIYLFSLKDSTFTNFTWSRSVPVDSVLGAADEFLNAPLDKRANNK